jgi:predicted Zn-dependent protease
LTNAEASMLRPYRLQVISPAGASAQQLAARMPYADYKLERLLVLNGTDSPTDLASRAQVKIIQP